MPSRLKQQFGHWFWVVFVGLLAPYVLVGLFGLLSMGVEYERKGEKSFSVLEILFYLSLALSAMRGMHAALRSADGKQARQPDGKA